jgi:signal transduction histidine kinase
MRHYVNRFWIRLSIVSTLMVLIGVLLVGLASIILTRNELLVPFIEGRIRSEGGLLDQLTIYYREHGNWTGVETLINEFDPPLIRGPSGGWSLTFANEVGTVLFDPHTGTVGKQLTMEQLADSLAVNVDGRTRGYVRLEHFNVPPPEKLPESLQPFIFRQLSQILLILAGVGGILGISAGVLLSRGLTAPLNDLAKTVQEFGAKNFSKRAKVSGSEEVVAVASAFNEMADALEAAEMTRRNMVADVAHELRTPLTVLQANLQAILDGVYSASPEEMHKLMEQTELLSHLVNDLHVLAQLEAKQLPLFPDKVDLAKLVDSTAHKFEPIATTNHIDLQIEVPPQEVPIKADANRIQQVVNNLVQNALTFTPSGGKVSVSLSQQNHDALIVVKDTGGGISAEHLPHVFERFYRVDRSRSRTTGGAGLGLAIVKAIVDMHGGETRVDSSGIPGEGSTFRIRLPLDFQPRASSS